jgi:methylated-DNA-protein-cysteine methyltransferase-like protein
MDFYKRIVLVCKQIPYGRVATYGQIALLCQRPKNSRQVGYGLSRKITEDVNAHRIVNSQGFLSGASAFSKNSPQRKLLEKEGVIVLETENYSGPPELKVDLKLYGWKNTLDDALYLEAIFKQEGV